jgi:adenylate cyclase
VATCLIVHYRPKVRRVAICIELYDILFRGGVFLMSDARKTDTRRLTAILAADVVGYSKLMGADEAGTARAVREHRAAATPIVRAFGGRLVKTMGDGVLIEFPSIVTATGCAIAIQKLMVMRNTGTPEGKRIFYRIGVNLGDVIVDGDDILGDGVNVAARLESICEPGGVCASGSAYDQFRGRVEADFVDLGEKLLKNIERAVRVWSLSPEAVAVAPEPSPTAAEAPEPAAKPASTQRRWPAIAAALVVALLAASGAAWRLGAVTLLASTPAVEDQQATAPRLSIVVLPFDNLSGDKSQDYFADGITENLTTDISRIKNSFVIARNTAFTYKGKKIDIKKIGKELGVRYALEGSVQRDQNRIRINAQFVDAETGAHLWANRFEEDASDLFKLQDEVVARLANALRFEILYADVDRGLHSKNPDAVDLAMRGMSLIYLSGRQSIADKRESCKAAGEAFEQALKIDPNNAEALAGDAGLYVIDYWLGWGNADTDYEAKIIGQADRAISLSQNLYAYAMKAYFLGLTGRLAEAVRVAGAGLEINPNYAELYAARAHAETALLRFDQARSDLQRAMRLSPRDPYTLLWQVMLGDVEIGAGNTKAAIAEYEKARDGGYSNYDVYLNLAAAYALDGKMSEAKSSLAQARRLAPQLTVKWSTRTTMDLPRRTVGMRLAGLPEE